MCTSNLISGGTFTVDSREPWLAAVSIIFAVAALFFCPRRTDNPVTERWNRMGTPPGCLMSIHHPYDTHRFACSWAFPESHSSPRDGASLRKTGFTHMHLRTMTTPSLRRTKTGGAKFGKTNTITWRCQTRRNSVRLKKKNWRVRWGKKGGGGAYSPL